MNALRSARRTIANAQGLPRFFARVGPTDPNGTLAPTLGRLRMQTRGFGRMKPMPQHVTAPLPSGPRKKVGVMAAFMGALKRVFGRRAG